MVQASQPETDSSTPTHIQELADKIARHHVHKCPICSILWGCQAEQCKPEGSLLARTACSNHAQEAKS